MLDAFRRQEANHETRRKYYIVSLLVILEVLIPFMLVFEGRRPQARELIIIAALCGIGVAGRVAFYWLPQFKPVTALVIITAVAFGAETGFLVGAVTAFASNFFFGQGPWTPWQMFAFGIIGYLAGLLFHKGFLRRNRWALSCYGFVATQLIYGGLMNASNVLMYQEVPTIGMFMMSFLIGVPFDFIHAIATVTFLMLAAKPMLEKLDRVKLKYGLLDQ